jgi:hypothetical protein
MRLGIEVATGMYNMLHVDNTPATVKNNGNKGEATTEIKQTNIKQHSTRHGGDHPNALPSPSTSFPKTGQIIYS